MKRRILAIAAAVLACAGAGAAAQRVVDIESPKMKVYLPAEDKSTGRAVVCLPGGGYAMLSNSHEGHHWAEFFNDLGLAFAVVDYRLPHGDRTLPIGDAENAMRVMRDSSEVWGLRRNDIGIMGSSAGGHLASTVATHAPADARPDFQILFYPVITMDKSYTHMGSHNFLLGESASKELEDEYSNELKVDESTPRAFIVFSDDDGLVPPKNGINYYSALHDKGIPASIYIYPSGGHGWGFSPGFRYHDLMTAELSAWLKSF